jgi:hypothetical protein
MVVGCQRDDENNVLVDKMKDKWRCCHGCFDGCYAVEIEREARHVKEQGLTIVICRTSCN